MNTEKEIIKMQKSDETDDSKNREADNDKKNSNDFIIETKTNSSFKNFKDPIHTIEDNLNKSNNENNEEFQIFKETKISKDKFINGDKLIKKIECTSNLEVNIFNTIEIKNNSNLQGKKDNKQNSKEIVTKVQDEIHDRSDGSDSGLGSDLVEEQIATSILITNESDSETSFLDRIPDEILKNEFKDDENSKMNNEIGENKDKNKLKSNLLASDNQPSKSNLKRKLDKIDKNVSEPLNKKRRSVQFDNVTVYYFPRAQGFTCVPSQGGSTLGMTSQHTFEQKFSIVEHAQEQRRVHRQLIQQLRNESQLEPSNVSISSSDDSDSEEDPSDISDTELDVDNYYFLQPVPTRQRRAILRSAGVRKIDSIEKDECRSIRTSREFCGCECKVYCDPDSCSCSQNGIKCQVDRLNFPCGCSRDNCGNANGRIEFNPVRVRTHFIHTLMRLELEKKQREEEPTKFANNWINDSPRFNTSPSKYNSNLLKDFNLTSHVEVESCIQNGSFTNLQYDNISLANTSTIHTSTDSFSNNLPSREDSLDLYTFREECYETDSTDHSSDSQLQQNCENNVIRKHLTYYQNMLNFNQELPRFPELNLISTASSLMTPTYMSQQATTSQIDPQSNSRMNQSFLANFNDFNNCLFSFGSSSYNSFDSKKIESKNETELKTISENNNKYISLDSVTSVGNKLDNILQNRHVSHNNNFSAPFDDLNDTSTMDGPSATFLSELSTPQSNGSLSPTDSTQCSMELLPTNTKDNLNYNEKSDLKHTPDETNENFGEIIKNTMVESVSN